MHWGRSGGNTRTSDEACLGTSYSAKLSAERRRGWDHQARRRGGEHLASSIHRPLHPTALVRPSLLSLTTVWPSSAQQTPKIDYRVAQFRPANTKDKISYRFLFLFSKIRIDSLIRFRLVLHFI